MLGKAFERGDQEIGIVQALSILSCWKEPHDKGGWLRLGYAIRYAGCHLTGDVMLTSVFRMGYELGLDQPPQRPLPKDRLKALEVLVGVCISANARIADRDLTESRANMVPTGGI